MITCPYYKHPHYSSEQFNVDWECEWCDLSDNICQYAYGDECENYEEYLRETKDEEITTKEN